MATEITRTQVRSIVSNQFRTVDTVTAVVGLPDVYIYLHSVEPDAFVAVCTPSDLTAYPTSRGAAISQSKAYYRKSSLTLNHPTAARANVALATLDARLTDLAVTTDQGAVNFPGTEEIVVTAAGVV